MDQVENLTKDNKSLLLNVCFAYNSTYEIDEAFKVCCEIKEDVTIDKFYNNLLIPVCPDILVRTSNEIRLSNFMLA